MITRRCSPQPNTASDAATSAADSSATRDAAADFRALFTAGSNPPVTAVPASTASNAAPTAQSLFGPNPWMTNPSGVAPNGVTYSYNPYYFATAETAAKVAQMVGGTVVQQNAITPYGPFQQNQPNYMVQLASGRQINAGLFASFFDHGYTQDFVNRLVASELNDTSA
ncbi:MAG TPA: hypothetical protein VMH28_32125 [Candidatus Acidoferrales bacterium]|nr:hypothetical protein [Candidatus Acidoferrales bacterium]